MGFIASMASVTWRRMSRVSEIARDGCSRLGRFRHHDPGE
jgi:hypothetical protein